MVYFHSCKIVIWTFANLVYQFNQQFLFRYNAHFTTLLGSFVCIISGMKLQLGDVALSIENAHAFS